jgi:SAM-dependent methyltransferase
MFEEIVRVARASSYDFRMTACPGDPLAYRFDEWINYYKGKWAISRVLKPDTILEIGVRFGYAAAAFLDASPSSRYVGVDSDVDASGGARRGLMWAKTITQQFDANFVVADSEGFDRLPTGTYDLVQLNGRQDADGSIHDLELSMKQARYILLDGLFWTHTSFSAVNEFIYRYRDLFEFYGVIPGYAAELLIKVSAECLMSGDVKNTAEGRSSLEVRQAYTPNYYLFDCGGFDSYKKSKGKDLDLRLRAVADIAGMKNQGRVLDLGCGRGELAYDFCKRGFTVTAVDYSRNAIELAQTCFDGEEELRAKIEFRQESVTTVGLQGEYDLAIASDLIEHLSVEEVNLLYSRVSERLKTDGLFVLHTSPNLWYYRWAYPRKRKIAASVGAYLPAQPRTRYELMVHINEQSPRVMKRQLKSHFEHVLIWFGDPFDPGGSLLQKFGKQQLAGAMDLFAIASHSPIDSEDLKVRLGTKALPPISPGDLELDVKERPLNVVADTVFNVTIEIKNSSSYVLDSRPLYPVNIAYHWIDEETSQIIVFDGERSPLIPLLYPESKRSYAAHIRAPGEPGRYILRMTLVQEGVRWFDQAPTMLESDVSVVVK